MPTETATTRDWRTLLAHIREERQRLPHQAFGIGEDRARILAAADERRFFDLRLPLRAAAFQNHANEPAPIMRAQVFAAVLKGMPLADDPGDPLPGRLSTWQQERLPDGIDEGDYAEATRLCRQHGQRGFPCGWDHTLPAYDTILSIGLSGLKEEARTSPARDDAERTPTLDAFLICLDGLSCFIRRHAAIASTNREDERAAALEYISEHPPRTFHEALQLIWLIDLALLSEGRHHMALGCLDRWLWPLYREDLAAGRISREAALELICHLWVKLDEVGEVSNIAIGGRTADGGDATNELSYLFLEATALVQTPRANLSARLHDDSDEAFLDACFRCLRTGVGFPAIFNDEVDNPAYIRLGIAPEHASEHCMVGCHEAMIPGHQPGWSDSRFSMPQRLLNALSDGSIGSFEDLFAAFREQLRLGLTAHARQVSAPLLRFPADRYPDPVLSALSHGCLATGRDINDGGTTYPRFHGVCCMGLGTVADSLAAIKTLVFERKVVDLPTLRTALAVDFRGHEELRQRLLNQAPKYGNDIPQVDQIAGRIVALVGELTEEHRLPDGGRILAAMGSNIQNIDTGRVLGATPDGRHGGEPVSNAASPTCGRERKGPTAILRSLSVPDYSALCPQGAVINMRFDPRHFPEDSGHLLFRPVFRQFLRGRIAQLQFNFNANELLREAMEHPEDHADLVVRVTGFSAYFTRLHRRVQEDLVERQAH